MKRQKHILTKILASLLAVSMLAGCGAGKEGSTGSGATGSAETMSAKADENLSEFAYVATFTDIPENSDFYSCQISDGLLWSQSYEGDDENSSRTVLKGLDPETLETKVQLAPADYLEVPEAGDGVYVNTYVNDYGFAPDGTIYAIICVYQYTEGSEDYSNTFYLMHVTKEGEVLFVNEITDLMGEDGYISYLSVDDDGNIFMAGDTTVYLVDSQGNSAGTIALSDWANGMFRYQGTIYVMIYGNNGLEAYPLDFANAKLGSKLENFPHSRYISTAAELEDGRILESGSTEVYINDPASGNAELLFKWSDLNIAGDQVQAMAPTGNDNYIAVIYDWNSGESSIANIKKVMRSEVPNTQTLTLGLLYEDQDITSDVIKYNKSQTDYRIEIKTYYDWNTDMAFDEAVTNFQNELLGGNPPDMIFLNGYDPDSVSFETLQSKGIVVDLSSYFAAASDVDLNDYAPEAKRVFSVGDAIYGLPTTLFLDAPVGKASILGSKAGWTIDECMQIIAQHPEADIMDYTDRSYAARLLMGYSLERFANFETGEVNLNTPAFKQVLEFLKQQKSEIDYMEYESAESSPKRMEKGTILLLNTSLSGPEDIQMYDAMTGGANYIGYPTMDGAPCYGLNFEGAYMITNNCSDPQACFDFIKTALNKEPDRWMYGIPSKLSARETYFEHFFTPEGSIKGNGIGWDDWEYTYDDVKREDVAKLNEMISNARVIDPHFSEVYAIIDEEAQAFYNNQKSAEDVMDIIQSRVSLYIKENR